MNWYTHSVLFLSLACSSMAKSESFLSSKIYRKASAAATVSKPKNTQASKCANLSGHWAGQCVNRKDPSDTEQRAIVIEHKECMSVGIDNMIVPSRGSISSQLTYASQSLENLNASIVMSGAWNDAQSRYTVTHLAAVPGLGMNLISSVNFELEGDILVVSDGDYDFIVNEHGMPTEVNFVKYDCRLTRKP